MAFKMPANPHLQEYYRALMRDGARVRNEREYVAMMRKRLMLAFTEAEMIENAALVVWTKAQMRGIRATLLRTRKDHADERTEGNVAYRDLRGD